MESHVYPSDFESLPLPERVPVCRETDRLSPDLGLEDKGTGTERGPGEESCLCAGRKLRTTSNELLK